MPFLRVVTRGADVLEYLPAALGLGSGVDAVQGVGLPGQEICMLSFGVKR